MSIQILGKNPTTLSYWLATFQLADPNADFSIKIRKNEIHNECMSPEISILFLTDHCENEEYQAFLNAALEENVKIIFSAHLTKENILKWIGKGVSGVINEHISISQITTMLSVIDNGGVFYLPDELI